jgi:hypothetical protein
MVSLALGHHTSVDDLASTWEPRSITEPNGTLDREQWQDAVRRAREWIPALSGVDF